MKNRGLGIAVALALLAVVSVVDASSRSEIRKQAELSMVVKGSIDIGLDGSVEGYKVEKSEQLSPAILDLLAKQIPKWKFEPVQIDGKPVHARTNASLRIVASPLDDGNYTVAIRSASFSGGSDDEAEQVTIRHRSLMGPLGRTLEASGAAGDVYLALKIGPDGKVLDGIVEQVNLTAFGTDEQMARARKILGDGTLDIIRKWTFNPPTAGELAVQPYWSGILPVSFHWDGPGEKYGQWKAYIPGPCTEIPWRVLEPGAGVSHCHADSAPDGAFTLDNSGPKLLTPLTQG
jgi:hypothetical protein